MSSTRHAVEGSPFRTERYCSSPEFNTGLPGNLVARRCSVLRDRAERELIYFIQLLSHKEGGVEDLARQLRDRFSENFGTVTMRRLPRKPGQFYRAEEVRGIRREMPAGIGDTFTLKGESDDISLLLDKPKSKEVLEEEASYPDRYCGTDLMAACHEGAENLDRDLRIWCLNPEVKWPDGGPWYFVELKRRLREYMQTWIHEKAQGNVTTQIGKRVDETLDYALAEKGMVVIEGRARMGKTFSARAWCDRHPGQSRYVQVPSTNDDNSFYRAIAKGLGLGSGQSLKGSQVRQKVEDTLQTGDLLLVLDEAWALWPQQARMRDALPRRVNFVMTALANYGVPVALVSSPQFFESQRVVEKSTHWASEQFIGRILHFERLPESLAEEDLSAVARRIFPEGSQNAIKGLVAYARTTAKYLAGIEAVVKRARFLARRSGRDAATEADIYDAIVGSVVPSDSALAKALGMAVSEPALTTRQAPRRPISYAVQGVRKAPAGPVQREAHITQKAEASDLALATV